MSTWTINGGELDDLDVDTIVFSMANQEEDYAEIRFDAAYDAALPSMFQVGAPVIIRYGSQIVFQGEIDNPSFHGSGSIEYQSVFVFGPWHRFNQMLFLYMYPYVTGAALSTHGVIGGSANSLLGTILSTNAGDFFQVGTIDVGTLTIPEAEVYDQTLAQTIQSILRYIPGAQVIFDYSTTPPTCHVLADNSSALQTVAIDPNDGLTSNLNLTPLYNRLADGVSLQYEASGSDSLRQLAWYKDGYGTPVDTTSSPAVSSGFFILGYDSAGSAQSRRHFRRTIRLEGVYDVSRWSMLGQLWPYRPQYSLSGGKPYTLEDFISASTQSGSTATNLKIMTDRAMYFSVFGSSANNFSLSFSGRTTASFAQAGTPGTSLAWEWLSSQQSSYSGWYKKMRPLMLIGPGRSMVPSLVNGTDPSAWWPSIPSGFLQSVSGGTGLRVLKTRHRWDFTNFSGAAAHSQQDSGYATQWIDNDSIGAIDSATGRFQVVITVSNNSAAVPAAGIAAQILAANSRLLWEGGCTVLLEDTPTRFFGLNRKATVAALGASTVVQRFTLDTASGLCDLTFGAPTHLGPQDLITLLRAGSPA